MQKYNGKLINQFPNSINGNAAAGAQITVRVKSSGALASLYATDNLSGAALSNPLTADSRGYYGFYAPDGVYTLDVNISGTPQLEIQLQDVAALQAQFNDALANAGYIPVGTFAAGCTVSQSNGVVSDGTAYWRWDGALPKTVTAGSAPTPTGVGGWVLISDGAFRAALAGSGSTELIAGVEAFRIAPYGAKYVAPSNANQTTFVNALFSDRHLIHAERGGEDKRTNEVIAEINVSFEDSTINDFDLTGNKTGDFAASLSTGVKYAANKSRHGMSNVTIGRFKDAGINLGQTYGLFAHNLVVKYINHPDRLAGTYGYGITTKSATSTYSNAHKVSSGEVRVCDVGIHAVESICFDAYNLINEGHGFAGTQVRASDCFQFPYYTEANNLTGGSYDMEYLTPVNYARFSRLNRLQGTYHNPSAGKKLMDVKGTNQLIIRDVLTEPKGGANGSGIEGRITLGGGAINTRASNLINTVIEDSTGAEVRIEQDCELSGNLFRRSEQVSNAIWNKGAQVNLVEDAASDGATFLDGSAPMRVNLKAGVTAGTIASLFQALSTTGALKGKVVNFGVWMKCKTGQSLRVAPIVSATTDYSGDSSNLPIREIVSDKWTFVSFNGVISLADASNNANFGWRFWAATGSAANGDGTYDVYIKYPRATEGALEHVKYLPTVGAAAKERVDGAGLIPVSAGDASVTAPSGSVCQVFYSAPITAARAVTLDTANPIAGDRLTVTRTAASTGAFNVAVGALKNLTAAGQWATVVYDGAAWQLAAYGTL